MKKIMISFGAIIGLGLCLLTTSEISANSDYETTGHLINGTGGTTVIDCDGTGTIICIVRTKEEGLSTR